MTLKMFHNESDEFFYITRRAKMVEHAAVKSSRLFYYQFKELLESNILNHSLIFLLIRILFMLAYTIMLNNFCLKKKKQVLYTMFVADFCDLLADLLHFVVCKIWDGFGLVVVIVYCHHLHYIAACWATISKYCMSFTLEGKELHLFGKT